MVVTTEPSGSAGGKAWRYACWDMLGRVTDVAKKVASPGGSLGTDQWFHKHVDFDGGGRPTRETNGAGAGDVPASSSASVHPTAIATRRDTPLACPHDDLYRLTRIDYQSPDGPDTWVDPYQAEAAADLSMDNPSPSPRADFGTDGHRVMRQTFTYDWKGNLTATDDDAHAFFDRSLGKTQDDGYQLKSATNTSKGGTRTGSSMAGGLKRNSPYEAWAYGAENDPQGPDSEDDALGWW